MKMIKLFIVYFPVTLVMLQVLANGLYFIAPEVYNVSGFYLNTFLGTNILFAVFLVAFTFTFRFCSVSRWAAAAECLFGLFYLVIQKDNVYNILFQITVGAISLIITFWHYVKKFPLCKVSLLVGFFGSAVKSGSCKKGLEQWDRNVKSIILKTQRQHENHH